MKLWREIKHELLANYFRERLSFLGLMRLLIHLRSWGIILIRFAVKGSRPARLLLQIIFHTEIAHKVSLGKSIFLPHPFAIVMAEGTEIGDNCSIYHRVTFAEKGGIHKGPKVGNNCVIGTGSVLIGNIVIGDNVKIGPNSVVLNNLESNVIAFGNPLQTKAR
jgi:serine acetyltransferase